MPPAVVEVSDPVVLLPPPPRPEAPPAPPIPPFAAADDVACAELEQVVAREAQPPVPTRAVIVETTELEPVPPR